MDGGRDESKRHRLNLSDRGSKATLPLTIPRRVFKSSAKDSNLPAARWKLYFKAARAARPPRGLHQRHVPLVPGPYCRSAIGRRARASLLARILT
ncbi:hypothetical protein SLA2020_277320 [Shorea laevis]